MAGNNSSEQVKNTNAVYLDLDTKSLCLLCFTQVKTLDSDTQFTSINSFKQFLRYLKINICDLKSIKNSPYSSVDNSNVTLILCQECGTKSQNFTEQHIAWEEMGRKLKVCVQEIHKQILNTDADPVKVNEYRRQMKGEDKPWNVVLTDNVVEDLRKEAIDKCSNGIIFANSQNSTSHSLEQTTSPFNQDEDMGEDEPANNSQGNTESAVSVPSPVFSPVVPVDVVNDEVFVTPLTRPLRVLRPTNRYSPHNPLGLDGSIVNTRFSTDRFLSVHRAHLNQFKRRLQSPLAIPSLTCLTCSKVCQTRAGFFRHTKSHSGNKTPARSLPEDCTGQFKCAICRKSFMQEGSRRIHMAARHAWNYLEKILPRGVSEAQLEIVIRREVASMTTSLEGNEKKFPFQCLHCSRFLHSKSDLRAHIVAKHHNKFKFT